MKIFNSWKMTLIILICLEFAIFGFLDSKFLDIDNLLYSVGDFLYIALAALPMTLVIVTGGIDISVGATMGLSSIVTALLWYSGMNIWVALFCGLVSGGLAGLLNGWLILLTRVNPLVITLGSSFLLSGVALILSGLAGATGFEGISGLPESFSNIANGMIFNIPNPVWILLFFALIFYGILHMTKFGRYLFLLGTNPEAAKYSGFDTIKLTIATYMIMGVGAACSGIMLTSYFTSARADLGSDSPLSVITCVVLGGASIYGGRGSIVNTLLASFLIGYLKYGLQMIRVSSEATNIYLGLLLITVIAGRHFWGEYANYRKNVRVLHVAK